MVDKQQLMIPVFGVLPTACAPGGFESLEGFGEYAGDDDEAEGETDEPIEGPFELVAAEFEDSDTIVLTFSHPLAAFDEVDPASFRISIGFATSYFSYYYGKNYEATRYWDANYIGYYYGNSEFLVMALDAGPSDSQLRLQFESEFTGYACSWLASLESIAIEPPNFRDAGLFVHHRPGDIPLRDVEQTDLAPIGPDWVGWPYNFLYVAGTFFTYLDPKVEIPCP